MTGIRAMPNNATKTPVSLMNEYAARMMLEVCVPVAVAVSLVVFVWLCVRVAGAGQSTMSGWKRLSAGL